MILNTISSKDLLIDAYKFYSRGDARAHDALRIIIDRNGMTAAVLGCLAEAKREEEPSTAIEEFQSTCRLLRVLNICRSQGLDDIDNLDSVIDQLVRRRQFSLALWIVKWLKIEGEKKVLEEWTEFMIRKSYLQDEAVASRIQMAFGQDPVITYADVASKAIAFNRTNLAIKLLENEGRSVKKIPLLMDLKQYDLMLSQALATCDSNLIYMAIFGLKDSMPFERQFLMLLKKHKLAYRYYLNFLSNTDLQKLILISHEDGETREELVFSLLDSRLESALAVCKRTKQDTIAHLIESRSKLSKFQQEIKQPVSPPRAQQGSWLGLSICDTIINLIASGNSSKAKDCQRRFEISDKKYKVLEQIAFDSLPELVIQSTSTS